MWIKETLKSKGFKLKDMAETLGITAPRVTDILRGTREVQSDELERLGKLLGLNLQSLLASLAAGELKQISSKADPIAVAGYLMGDGSVTPLGEDESPHHLALPPDVESADGLYCYIMGDNSMAQEIKAGDILIAADPRIHFYPMVPGALFLVNCGGGKAALRQFVNSDSGENWLVPLPEQPDPKLASWRFEMLPASLSTASNKEPAPKETGTEIPAGGTVHSEHIVAAVLWVHRRYTPPSA